MRVRVCVERVSFVFSSLVDPPKWLQVSLRTTELQKTYYDQCVRSRDRDVQTRQLQSPLGGHHYPLLRKA